MGKYNQIILCDKTNLFSIKGEKHLMFIGENLVIQVGVKNSNKNKTDEFI